MTALRLRPGLDSPTFNGQIFATAVTKKLVQETMITAYRVRLEEMAERNVGRMRKFANLCSVRPGGKGRGAGMDRIVRCSALS